MAVTTPLYMNGVAYGGEAMRRGLSGLLAQSAAGVPRGGVLGAAPEVTVSGSMVKVGPFNAAVSSAKGAYLLAVDSVTDAGTLAVADATNPRMDRVVLEVLDPENGSGGSTRTGRLRVITGTPAALPGLPALPALALHVAQIQVPKSGPGSPVITVDCQFTAAAGAPVPVRSAAERDALPKVAGASALRLDVAGKHVEVWNGSKWQANYPGPYAMYTNTALLDVPLAAGGQIGPFRHAFPPGLFSKTPTVTFGQSNGRLNPFWNNVGVTGFDLYLRNDTNATAIAGGLISYIALQSDA